jgi:hypothetical protein
MNLSWERRRLAGEVSARQISIPRFFSLNHRSEEGRAEAFFSLTALGSWTASSIVKSCIGTMNRQVVRLVLILIDSGWVCGLRLGASNSWRVPFRLRACIGTMNSKYDFEKEQFVSIRVSFGAPSLAIIGFRNATHVCLG